MDLKIGQNGVHFSMGLHFRIWTLTNWKWKSYCGVKDRLPIKLVLWAEEAVDFSSARLELEQSMLVAFDLRRVKMQSFEMKQTAAAAYY